MKVCVVGLRGIPRVLGGVETHCEQLFPLLKRIRPNDEFTIIARKAYVNERKVDYEGIRVVALGHARGKHLETITNAIWGVFYAAVKERADLVHLHGIGPALTAPLARTLGLKVIVTYHSKNYEHRKWNMVGRCALRIGELFAVYFSDSVITVSSSLCANLKARFPRLATKIHCIPNGADHLGNASLPIPAGDHVLKKHNLSSGRYILSVGRLVPEKGFHDLIDAFNAANLDCKLVIAGEANRKDAYSANLRERAGDKIVFTGFVSRGELQVLLQNASLFVLPSHNEGHPIAALEAVVAGAPVLLSDISENLDLNLDPTNYFKVGDKEDLRTKLAGARERLRVDRERILQKYSWNRVGAETDKLYSVLQNPGSLRSRRHARTSAHG